MGLVETPFYHLECNGPAAVPWEKHCSNKFPGSYNQEELLEDAARNGWVATARSWFCPAHVPVAAESNGEAPARKRRQKTVQLPEQDVQDVQDVQ